MADQQLTMEQFGQRIKAKHPEYADIPDAELGQRVIAKHPEYSDMVSTAPPPPTPTQAPEVPWYEKALQTLKDGATGAIKSVEQSGTVGPTSPYASAVNLAYGDKGVSPANPAPEPKLQGTAQHVGAGLEQTLEMMGAGGVLKGLAEHFPEAMGKFLPRVAAEAAASGAVAKAHGEDAAPAAILAGGGAALGEVAPSVINGLRNNAQKVYAQALATTTNANKAIAKEVVPQLIDRGVYGTAKGLQKTAAANVESAGNAINDAVSNVPASVKPNPQNVINDLENYKQGFVVNGVPVNTAAVAHVEALQNTIKQMGDDISYQSLNRARQIWDKQVADAGGYVGKSMKEGSQVQAQEAGANAIRAELAKQSPDIAKLNAEFSFWKDVQRLTDATDLRKTGQQGFMKQLLPVAGAAGGFAHGGSMEAALGAAGVYAVHQAVTSSAYRTAGAVIKSRLADAIAKGDAAAVSNLTAKILAGQTSAQSSPQ